MIIQCPKCATKFSVESSLVHTVTNPRFHCSRCDHLFRQEEISLASSELEELNSDTSTSSIETAEFIEEEISTALPESLPAASKQLELLPIQERTLSSGGNDLDEDLPYVTADWPDSSSNMTFEADMRGAVQRGGSGRASLFSHRNSLGNGHGETNFDALQTPTQQTQTTLVKETPPLERSAINGNCIAQVDDLDEFYDEEQDEEQEVQSLLVANALSPTASTPIFSASFYRPVVFLASCPVIFLLILWISGVFLFNDSDRVVKLFSIFNYDAPIGAPTGLVLTELQSQYIVLENGKQVLEIRGMLRNDSERTLHDVKLEAQLYDRNNIPVTTLLVNQNNALMNAAGINALQESVLKSLQHQIALKSDLVKPNDQIPVRFVFTDNVTNVSYFTARVYSVKDYLA